MQTYLLHSGLILAFLSIFYWLLLRRETFFKANRWLLLTNIIMALVIPLLPTPAPIIQLKTDLIDSFQPMEIKENSVTTLEDSNIPSSSSSESILPVETSTNTPTKPLDLPISKPAPISWLTILTST